MPKKSVVLVRLALVYFFVGSTIGSALQLQKVVPVAGWLWALRPLHIEVLLFGFMLHLAFGVALWILPKAPAPQSDGPVWWAAVLLNLGVWLVGTAGWISEGILGALLPGSYWALIGRSMEIAAVSLFALQIIPRVRSIESFRRTPPR